MYSISQLARMFDLSRSTLLYYDSIGLLKASSRVNANYRSYSEADRERLEKIQLYRQAGLSLNDIKQVLDGPESALGRVLEQRLNELNDEIQQLRHQQYFILTILQNKTLWERIGIITKESWVSLLESVGIHRLDRWRWHHEFERLMPEKHQRFLESIGLIPEDIQMLRDWAAAPPETDD